jgi:hypothetical protein
MSTSADFRITSERATLQDTERAIECRSAGAGCHGVNQAVAISEKRRAGHAERAAAFLHGLQPTAEIPAELEADDYRAAA